MRRFTSIYKSPAWRRARAAVLERDEWECVRCHRYGHTVHHISPLADGGAAYDLSNLQVLCRGIAMKSDTTGSRYDTPKSGGSV